MAEEENKQEQPQMTETAGTMNTTDKANTAEKTEEPNTSGWRYAGI